MEDTREIGAKEAQTLHVPVKIEMAEIEPGEAKEKRPSVKRRILKDQKPIQSRSDMHYFREFANQLKSWSERKTPIYDKYLKRNLSKAEILSSMLMDGLVTGKVTLLDGKQFDLSQGGWKELLGVYIGHMDGPPLSPKALYESEVLRANILSGPASYLTADYFREKFKRLTRESAVLKKMSEDPDLQVDLDTLKPDQDPDPKS